MAGISTRSINVASSSLVREIRGGPFGEAVNLRGAITVERDLPAGTRLGCAQGNPLAATGRLHWTMGPG
jgi:hypothetical protein